MLDAILLAHEEIKKIIAFIDKIVDEAGKEKNEVTIYQANEELEAKIHEYAADKVEYSVDTTDRSVRDERTKR